MLEFERLRQLQQPNLSCRCSRWRFIQTSFSGDRLRVDGGDNSRMYSKVVIQPLLREIAQVMLDGMSDKDHWSHDTIELGMLLINDGFLEEAIHNCAQFLECNPPRVSKHVLWRFFPVGVQVGVFHNPQV